MDTLQSSPCQKLNNFGLYKSVRCDACGQSWTNWPDLLPRQTHQVQAMASDRRGAPAYLADGADDLEADGAGLELGPLGFLVPLRVTPLRVDLLLPARHPSASTAAALSAATGGFLPPAIGFGSPPAPALPCPASSSESGCFFAYLAVPSDPESGASATPSFSTPGLHCIGLAGHWPVATP